VLERGRELGSFQWKGTSQGRSTVGPFLEGLVICWGERVLKKKGGGKGRKLVKTTVRNIAKYSSCGNAQVKWLSLKGGVPSTKDDA